MQTITSGLNSIHSKGLVHKDFHSGNILNYGCLSYITDLGLCRPTSGNDDEKIYGVLPYVAPEVLLKKTYTQSSDIYSFGIVAYEVMTGLPPYHDRPYDIDLALGICQGLRPTFNIKIPQLLEDLIKQCWDADPLKRPTANELEKDLSSYYDEIKEKRNTKFTQQLQEAEEYNQLLPKGIKFPKYKVHPEAIYTSRILPTKKQITELLQHSKEINNEFWGSRNIDLNLEVIENLGIQEDSQEESSIQAQIQIPPK